MNISSFKSICKNRLPGKQEITSVYAVTTFLIFGWTLIHFFRKMPSWLYFLSLGEVMNLLPFAFTVNIFESILLMLFILGLCFILPPTFLRQKFVARGSILSLLLLVWMAIFDYLAAHRAPSDYYNYVWGTLVFIPGFVYLVGRFLFLERAISKLSDHFTIFLYLLIPIGIIGTVITLIKFILGGIE